MHAQAWPVAEVMGEATVRSLIRGRGPQRAPVKERVNLRHDAEVVSTLRASGPGWQSRVNAMLRKAVMG